MHHSPQFENHCNERYPYTKHTDRGQPPPLSLPHVTPCCQIEIASDGDNDERGGGFVFCGKCITPRKSRNIAPNVTPYTRRIDRGQPPALISSHALLRCQIEIASDGDNDEVGEERGVVRLYLLPPAPKLQLIISSDVEWNVIFCLTQDRIAIGDSLNFQKGCFECGVIFGRIRKEVGTFWKKGGLQKIPSDALISVGKKVFVFLLMACNTVECHRSYQRVQTSFSSKLVDFNSGLINQEGIAIV
ncbi:hypothetical protein CEXT_515281 [Caerostris extrusa]|uniref:Uncharacterized protein n=1 Tax=Caerostris extrusa TaxID=172846 RepID=A0AAV4NY12_CAEEX|nr:hypothetical protein CEXT_515281 [Caerostris extrusa]